MRRLIVFVIFSYFLLVSNTYGQVVIIQGSIGTTFQDLENTYINDYNLLFDDELFKVDQNNYLSARMQFKYSKSTQSRWSNGIAIGYQNSYYGAPFSFGPDLNNQFDESIYIENLEMSLKRYNIGLQSQFRVFPWFSVFGGFGTSLLDANFDKGYTYSDFHFYDVDLSTINPKPTGSVYINGGLQLNIKISETFALNILGEYSKMFSNKIIGRFFDLEYSNFALEVGGFYTVLLK